MRMSFTRIQRRFTAWLAMLALALGAVAPAVAQVVVTDRSDWVEICNASGMVWVQADHAPSDADSAPLSDMGMQCSWCSLHSPTSGLPPALMTGVVSNVQMSVPGRYTPTAPPASVWTAAPARAPPAVS